MEVRKGYKKTAVGVIPEDWGVRKLSSFCEMISSKRIFESDYVLSGIPFYRGTEISLLIGGKNIEEPYYISKERYEGIKKQFGAPQKDEILVTAVGTLANVYLIPDNKEFYFKDGNLIWLKRIKDVDVKYFAIQIANYKNNIIDNAIGSSQKALTLIVLKNQKIPIPPTKTEQTAIATALSDTDALIQSLEKLIIKKRNIKQGAMQELLTGKKRLPGFSGEWETKKVMDVGEIITGSTPSTIVKNYWAGDVPWITPTDITEKRDIYNSEREISSAGLDVIRKLPPNSLLVTCIASIGKNAILRKHGACNQQINAVVPNDEYDVNFLYYLFESKKQYLLGHAGITATYIISKKDFSEIIFSVPPIIEQVVIAKVLIDMDADIEALAKKLNKYKMIKQGMMQELLTGKTRLI